MEKLSETNEGISILIYGQSGSGKTASCRNLPPDQTLWICTETQQTAAALQSQGWNEWEKFEPNGQMDMDREIKRITVRLQNDTNAYKYIVIDTVSGLYDVYKQDIADLAGKSPSELGIHIYKLLAEAWEKTFNLLEALREKGVDIIYLSHLGFKEETRGEEKKLNRRPDLPGKAPERLCSKIPITLLAVSFMGKDKPRFYLRSKPYVDGDYGVDKHKVLDNTEENDVKYILEKLKKKIRSPGKEEKETEEKSEPSEEEEKSEPLKEKEETEKTSEPEVIEENKEKPSQETNEVPAKFDMTKNQLIDAIKEQAEEIGLGKGHLRQAAKRQIRTSISQADKSQLQVLLRHIVSMKSRRKAVPF